MNRLVRIALTLFASSTVLIFLVTQRLQRAKQQGLGILPDEALSDFVRNEEHMAYAGLGLAGAMLLGGLVLLVLAFIRSRRSPVVSGSDAAPPHSHHG